MAPSLRMLAVSATWRGGQVEAWFLVKRSSGMWA